jgi:hypothetical protein
MSKSSKHNNPWMPSSDGVYGGGAGYDRNAYSVRGRGAANNPWVQGSGWWEEIVEGNYQGGFGQASQSNAYYSTRPVSPAEMRRMRTISAILAGGAVVGAAAAAGLFAGGGGAAAAGGAVAGAGGTTGAGAGVASGGLLSGAGSAIAGGVKAAGAALSSAVGSTGGAIAAGAASGAIASNALMAGSQATGLSGTGLTSGGYPNALSAGNAGSTTGGSGTTRNDTGVSEAMQAMDMPVGRYGMSAPSGGSGYAQTTGSNGYARSSGGNSYARSSNSGRGDLGRGRSNPSQSTTNTNQQQGNNPGDEVILPSNLNIVAAQYGTPQNVISAENPSGILNNYGVKNLIQWPSNWPNPSSQTQIANDFFSVVQYNAVYKALVSLGHSPAQVLKDLKINNRYGAVLNNASRYISNWSSRFDSQNLAGSRAFESQEIIDSGLSIKFYPDRENMISIVESNVVNHFIEAGGEILEYYGGPIHSMHEINAGRLILYLP